MLNVVLFQPENAGNVGNIIRTCAILKANLHLIRPYGWVGNLECFSPLKYLSSNKKNNQKLIRATMGAFSKIIISEHNSWEIFEKNLKTNLNYQIMFFTKNTANELENLLNSINNLKIENLYLVFGSETFGLKNLKNQIKLNPKVTLAPLNASKSYNLANAVAIGLYVCHNFLKNKAIV